MTRPRPGYRGLLAAAALALPMAGCADADFAPFGRTGPIGAPDSLTVRRVMGTDALVEPLLPEEGNVWPAAEAPRATLANPDAGATVGTAPTDALQRARRDRGIPPEPRLQSNEPGLAVPPGVAPSPRNPPPGTRRRGSTTPPDVLAPLDPQPLPRADVPPAPRPLAPLQRQEGRVVPVPGGPPAIISGGSGAIGTYSQPGVGTGTAINQGATTTLIGPDGRVQVVPNR
ncbi:hypothetical protein [Muricoccus radiodurans]|uniref:hypothetical protein n=1 Tax=Muricoccus radiodurans TaxID=2231721 RepID=UPI003CE7B3A7